MGNIVVVKTFIVFILPETADAGVTSSEVTMAIVINSTMSEPPSKQSTAVMINSSSYWQSTGVC